jgi:hypothetical protein
LQVKSEAMVAAKAHEAKTAITPHSDIANMTKRANKPTPLGGIRGGIEGHEFLLFARGA